MRKSNKSRRLAGRILWAFVLLLLLVGIANAYTVVMRGGRRVEIPSSFVVTPTTLTYEVANGIQVTLAMAAIDIPATELANNETAGALLGRVKEKEPAMAAEANGGEPGRKASRSITNRELESFARVRQESDRVYEQHRKALGLPPLEVARAKAAADAELFWQQLVRKREEEESRAAELRTGMAANAQLNYAQARVSQDSGALPSPIWDVYGIPYFNSFRAHSAVNRSLFRVPFGVQIGGAFGSSGVQVANPFGQQRLRNRSRRQWAVSSRH